MATTAGRKRRSWSSATTAIRYVEAMQCPVCHHGDTRVADSRSAEDGAAIRRRRYCMACERRFTTFERVEEVPIVVVKRDGGREAFCRDKIVRGLVSAKGRTGAVSPFDELATTIEEMARQEGGEVTSEWIGLMVLEHLRAVDEVAALRFASVYKGFTGVDDFEREMKLIKKVH